MPLLAFPVHGLGLSCMLTIHAVPRPRRNFPRLTLWLSTSRIMRLGSSPTAMRIASTKRPTSFHHLKSWPRRACFACHSSTMPGLGSLINSSTTDESSGPWWKIVHCLEEFARLSLASVSARQSICTSNNSHEHGEIPLVLYAACSILLIIKVLLKFRSFQCSVGASCTCHEERVVLPIKPMYDKISYAFYLL